jgi:hypothetical protein
MNKKTTKINFKQKSPSRNIIRGIRLDFILPKLLGTFLNVTTVLLPANFNRLSEYQYEFFFAIVL